MGNFFYRSKNSRYTFVILHVNINESNNVYTSNSDNVIGTSNLPHGIIKNDSPYNTLGNLQKVTDTYSSVSINDERTEEKNIRKEISSHKHSA